MQDAPDFLTLPETPLGRDVTRIVTEHASPALANHSFRSFLFARLAADEQKWVAGRDYEPDLLYCACALHDIGLTPAHRHGQRFEVDGADAAVELLTRHGVSAADADQVWQAIALNTSLGIVERRGPLCALTLTGVSLDFGVGSGFISDDVARAIHEAYPRLAIGKALADEIVEQARHEPRRAPPFSLPAQLLKERAWPPHVTELERLAREGRWRE